MIEPQTASAEIDLDAFGANVSAIAAHVAPAALMVVVKADAYGHGLVECARAARAAGAPWLGVATPGEALALRSAGDTGLLLTWLYGPGTDLNSLLAGGIDVSAQSAAQLDRLRAAAAASGRSARVHLKLDTGLSRNGAAAADWPELCRIARAAELAGGLRVVGVWSHLAEADQPGSDSVIAQQQAFEAGVELALEAGLQPELRHLANSAAALAWPELRYDLVRVGIAAYGIEPDDAGLAAQAGVKLRPVMRLRGQLVNVKVVSAGTGVSYGLSWHAARPARLGLIALGYADGIPRQASNLAEIGWAGGRAPIRGRVCMDQFVVELGEPGACLAEVGDEITIFGTGADGEPTASDWAAWCGTIGYEIVTRIGSRVPRIYSRSSSLGLAPAAPAKAQS